MPTDRPAPPPSLDVIRTRIDAIDAELLSLIDERSALAHDVAAAKRAAGGPVTFGLRPGREALIMRKLLATARKAASPALIVRIWRELIAASLSIQGPFNVTVYGGSDAARTVDLARLRFGVSPSLALVGRPEEALAATRQSGGVAVLSLNTETAWWARLLADPGLKVFAALPCLQTWGEMGALAVARVPIEPTGGDQTFWVTDASGPATDIIAALGKDGVAAELLSQSGGVKLFRLSGFYQQDDARLARAPGSLSGIIGAAPEPFDLLTRR